MSRDPNKLSKSGDKYAGVTRVATPEIRYQWSKVYIAITTTKSTGRYEADVVIEKSSKIGN